MSVNVDFILGNVCNYLLLKKFSLVIDGHVFHCIIDDYKRKCFLNNVKNVILSQGIFLLETMICTDKNIYMDEKFFLDDDFILWSTGLESWNINYKNIAGKNRFPHRRCLPADLIKQEIINAGFKIEEEKIIEQKGNLQKLLRLICSL